MTLTGIAHAIGTATSQVFATTAAHGVGAAAADRAASIAGALGGWVVAGITQQIVLGAGVVSQLGSAALGVIKNIPDEKKEQENNEDYTYDIFDRNKKIYKYKLKE